MYRIDRIYTGDFVTRYVGYTKYACLVSAQGICAETNRLFDLSVFVEWEAEVVECAE